jgi:hypothetical protein
MEYPNHKMSCKIPVEEWRLPTAEEYFEKRYEEIGINHVDEIDGEDVLIAIEFAKLHLEAQLEAILKNVKCEDLYVYGKISPKKFVLMNFLRGMGLPKQTETPTSNG